jgi:hypothetical protein
MADYFVASGGSNTSPYDTWAKAATSLQTALTAATTNGDRVIIQYNGVPATDQTTNTTDVVYTLGANVVVISASNDGGTSFTPTPMGESNYLGSTVSKSITIAGAFTAYFYGVTLRNGSTSSDHIVLGNTDGAQITYDSCLIWEGTTASAGAIRTGAGDTQTYIYLKNCVLRYGAVTQRFEVVGGVKMDGCSLHASSSVLNAGLFYAVTLDMAGGFVDAEGCDFSLLGSNAIVANATTAQLNVNLTNCKIGSGSTVLATQSTNNKSGAQVWLYNCSSGDTHYHMAHYDAMGSTVVETGIYANDGASFDGGTTKTSWKISTTANATYWAPYISPWFDKYHAGTSAITPYTEMLRDGSSTAFTDKEVWGEWSYQGTSGSTQSTLVSDFCGIGAAGSAQANGVGLSGWTGESGTAWSGKLGATASITPAEIGYLRARVCVGVASSTVYVDPTIRV